jgi:hypothetical protein
MSSLNGLPFGQLFGAPLSFTVTARYLVPLFDSLIQASIQYCLPSTSRVPFSVVIGMLGLFLLGILEKIAGIRFTDK